VTLAVVTTWVLFVNRAPNDHDDRKRMYNSKAAADRVVARMRSQGVPNAERLNSYTLTKSANAGLWANVGSSITR
jgi:hypothetical protein